jgi:pimeloyl-ACP methyl ester carboxylesterase
VTTKPNKLLRRTLTTMFALPLLVYTLYATVMYQKQLQILFPGASDQHHVFNQTLPAYAQEIEVPVSFGKARFIFLRSETGKTATAMIFAHGNFDRASDFVEPLHALSKRGVAVVSLEYPGYDGADGAPTFDDLNESASAAYDWLAHECAADTPPVVGVGYSMGGGIIAELTRHRSLDGLALLSTYTSIADMANRFALPTLLVRLPFDTLARVESFGGPVFVQHGQKDSVIPFRYGVRLAAAAHATFVPMPCGHADCNFATTVFANALPDWLIAHRLLVPQS